MNRLALLLAIACLLCAGAAPALAEDAGGPTALKQDLVTVVDGKLKVSRTEVCTIAGAGRGMQLHWEAVAPKSLLSRDLFVSTVATYRAIFLADVLQFAEIRASQLFEKMTCTPHAKPAGKPDITVDITMTKAGVEAAVTTPDGNTHRKTETWKQILGE